MCPLGPFFNISDYGLWIIFMDHSRYELAPLEVTFDEQLELVVTKLWLSHDTYLINALACKLKISIPVRDEFQAVNRMIFFTELSLWNICLYAFNKTTFTMVVELQISRTWRNYLTELDFSWFFKQYSMLDEGFMKEPTLDSWSPISRTISRRVKSMVESVRFVEFSAHYRSGERKTDWGLFMRVVSTLLAEEKKVSSISIVFVSMERRSSSLSRKARRVKALSIKDRNRPSGVTLYCS